MLCMISWNRSLQAPPTFTFQGHFGQHIASMFKADKQVAAGPVT